MFDKKGFLLVEALFLLWICCVLVGLLVLSVKVVQGYIQKGGDFQDEIIQEIYKQ